MKRTTIITALMGVFCHAAGAALVTFESFSLGPSGYDNGSDGGGEFTSGAASFLNNYDADLDTWSGFAISNVTNNTIKGSANQYSAIPGGGFGGSSNYAIGLYSTEAFGSTVVTFETPTSLLGLGTYITNTTWAYYEMSEGGDLNAKKFGGLSGDDPDWFKLVIEGFDLNNASTGSKEFYLADFRNEGNKPDYIVNNWEYVDLSPLGDSVRQVKFTLVASETGVNVPAYFAMDNFMAVPEPSSLLIVMGGLGLVLRRKR